MVRGGDLDTVLTDNILSMSVIYSVHVRCAQSS